MFSVSCYPPPPTATIRYRTAVSPRFTRPNPTLRGVDAAFGERHDGRSARTQYSHGDWTKRAKRKWTGGTTTESLVGTRDDERTGTTELDGRADQQTGASCRTERHPLQHLQRTRGNQAVQRLVEGGGQPKLGVGPANDRYEREADRVARAVRADTAP